jgi:hypothetical protein
MWRKRSNMRIGARLVVVGTTSNPDIKPGMSGRYISPLYNKKDVILVEFDREIACGHNGGGYSGRDGKLGKCWFVPLSSVLEQAEVPTLDWPLPRPPQKAIIDLKRLQPQTISSAKRPSSPSPKRRGR